MEFYFYSRGRQYITVLRGLLFCLIALSLSLVNGQSNIGSQIGNRDHSTVIHACKNIQKKLIDDTEFKLKVKKMKNQLSEKNI